MTIIQRALSFDCHGDHLYGVLTQPAATPDGVAPTRGVLVVVGGPQYRSGSHRQFTLLACALAEAGVPVLRFDYRGMGDSEGAPRNFEAVDDDLRAAIDQFFACTPGLQQVVLWGLCDAASAALMYAHTDARVSGLALLNPWVRTEAGIAKATLKHYYRGRIAQADFWKKIIGGRFDVVAALKSLRRLLGDALGARSSHSSAAASAEAAMQGDLPERMLAGLQRFDGQVLIILSGDDLTAREFADTVAASRAWKKALQAPAVTRRELAGANHTFSRRLWRDQVAAWTLDWLRR